MDRAGHLPPSRSPGHENSDSMVARFPPIILMRKGQLDPFAAL
jgi:hypothetical protein